ncbi:MAG: hypothetical protein NVSMB14_14770 [Isosphaeraceae bacterium]
MWSEESLSELVKEAVEPLGSTEEEGEEFRDPILQVLSYHARPVRLHGFPWFGRGASVVAIAREPEDLDYHAKGLSNLIKRVAGAANARFAPWRSGPTVGLSIISIARAPILPGEETLLAQVLAKKLPRSRVVPLGLFRVELEREAFSFSLVRGPAGLFTEPDVLADALNAKLKRYVSNIDGDQ